MPVTGPVQVVMPRDIVEMVSMPHDPAWMVVVVSRVVVIRTVIVAGVGTITKVETGSSDADADARAVVVVVMAAAVDHAGMRIAMSVHVVTVAEVLGLGRLAGECERCQGNNRNRCSTDQS